MSDRIERASPSRKSREVIEQDKPILLSRREEWLAKIPSTESRATMNPVETRIAELDSQEARSEIAKIDKKLKAIAIAEEGIYQ